MKGYLKLNSKIFFAELCYHIKLHKNDYNLSIYEIHKNFEEGKFSKELLCGNLRKTKELQQYINRMLIFLNEIENRIPIKLPEGRCSGKLCFGLLGYLVSLIFFSNTISDFWYGYFLTSIISGMIIWLYYIFSFYVFKSTQRYEISKPFKKLSNP